MSSRSDPSVSPASPLALVAVIVGTISFLAAIWATLAGVDAPELARQLLMRGQGAVSDETMAWMRELRPLRLLAFIGAALALAGAGVHFTRDRWRRWIERSAAAGASAKQGRLLVAAVAAVLVLGLRHSTFAGGFFRYDDFELLSAASTEPLGKMLFTPHGDHVLPLCRVLAWVAVHSVGAAAWPWNLAILGCMLGTLIVGARLLEELDVSTGARMIFVALVALWSPWAEILSGYYILSAYVAIVGLSLGAWLAFLRWRRSGGARHLFAFFLCLVLSPAFGVSGVYVIAAGAVFIGIDLFGAHETTPWRERLRLRAPAIGAVALTVALTAAWLLYAYAVLHPGKFLSMAGEEPRSLLGVAVDLFYVFDTGLLVSMGVPFIYARLPLPLLLVASSLAFLGFVAWLVPVSRSAGRTRRLHLLSALFVLAGICLMVVLGRPPEGSMIVRWAAKHVGPAYVWLCIFLALGWDTLWKTSKARCRLVELTILALGGFVAAQTAFGLLGMAVEFPPFGHPAEIRDAARRRDAVAALRADIVDKFPAEDGARAVIPALDGSYIQQRFPSLHLYNLSHYQPFFGPPASQPELVRGPGMLPGGTSSVRAVPDLAEAVDPRFLRLLAHDAALRRHYLAEIQLVPESNEVGISTLRPSALDLSEATTLVVRDGGFSPDEAPRLRLWLAPSATSGPLLRAAVVFHSEIAGQDWRGLLELPVSAPMPVVIDLRQAYAFSLGGRISHLRLVLPEADAPIVRLAELLP